MARSNYSVLFHFENEAISVLEIKRHFLNEEENSKVYKWIVYDKKNGSLNPLEFVSMNSNAEGGKEDRVFENASLNFDKKSATFIDSGKTYKLKPASSDNVLSQELKDAIGDYLLMLTFRKNR